jgi:membrane-associated phospholipid phosphatase
MASRMARNLLHELDTADAALYRAIAQAPSSPLDTAMSELSNAGELSGLWLAMAGGLLVSGRKRQRRAAAVGVTAMTATAILVDLVAKHAFMRRRPDRAARHAIRHVRMPRSASFPSGHSASAFAFATAVGGELPALAIPLRTLAAGVAYSRVHTGVHYPSDVIIGSLIGAAAGSLTHRAVGTRSANRVR